MQETFGNYIRYQYDGSISDLARSSGISRQYLYKIRDGLVNPDTMSYGYYVRLCTVLGITEDVLWLIIRNSFDEKWKDVI